MGLEPTRSYNHKILSLACLPIPALPQVEYRIPTLCNISNIREKVNLFFSYTALIGIFYYCSLMFTKSQKKCFIHIWPIYRCFSGNLSTSYMSGSPFFVFCGYFFEFHLPIDHFLWYNTFSCHDFSMHWHPGCSHVPGHISDSFGY